MKGIIIAGGLGTRLRPLTYRRPKHLLPVANRPFLEYQVALMKRHGIEEIIFATNYRAGQIEAQFGDGSALGVDLRYAIEDQPLGTAGAIRNAAALCHGESVLVFNGDILTDFDLGEILAFHRANDSRATIAMRAIERPHGFGVMETDSEGRVHAWIEPSEEQKRRVAENPEPTTGESDYINAGIYVLEPEALERIPTGTPVSIERETYPKLIAEGAPIYGIAPAGYWLDIGRSDQYLAANSAVLTRAVKTDVPFAQFGKDSRIDPGASVGESTAVGQGATVGSGSRLAGCIILDGVRVGANCALSGLIADEGCAIGDDVVAQSAVLAAGSLIERGSRL